jgi:multiple sugar transport system substrate-binding protein
MGFGRPSALQHGLSRRDFLGTTSMAAGAAAGLALTGRSVRSARAQDATEITMMGWGSPLEKENVEKGLQAFEGNNPNIKVDWVHVPEDYDVKLSTSLAGGTPPDVFWATNMRDYAARGVLLDVTSYIQADPVLGAPDYFMQPQETDRATVNGKWYGIGSCWVAPHLYYNVDLFTAAGVTPPSYNAAEAWTWDQFIETARALTLDSDGRHPGEDGFDKDSVDQWGVSWPTNSIARAALIYSNGGEIYGPDGLSMLAEPAAVQALQAMADLTHVHNVAPSASLFTQNGVTGSSGMDPWQALASGKVAMICDGSWALQDISKLGFNFGCGVLPKLVDPVTVSLAHCHVIHKDTEHPEEAWQLLAYLSSDDYQRGLCAVGLWLPSHTSLISEEGLATWITEGVHPEGYGAIASDYLLNYARALPYPPGYAEADRLVVSALDPVWIGDATVEEAMSADVIEQINAVLAKGQEDLAANA